MLNPAMATVKAVPINGILGPSFWNPPLIKFMLLLSTPASFATVLIAGADLARFCVTFASVSTNCLKPPVRLASARASLLLIPGFFACSSLARSTADEVVRAVFVAVVVVAVVGTSGVLPIQLPVLTLFIAAVKPPIIRPLTIGNPTIRAIIASMLSGMPPPAPSPVKFLLAYASSRPL